MKVAVVLGSIVASLAVSLAAQDAPSVPAFHSLQEHDAMLKQCQKATRFDPAQYYCGQITQFLTPTSQADVRIGTDALSRPVSSTVVFAQMLALMALEDQASTWIQLEAQRLDKQQGAPVSSDGSTNLVSKVGAPQLLALAVQSGALTQTQSGTTTTVQGNLDQLVRLVGGSGYSLVYSDHGTPVLKNITVSSTLTLSAPTTSNIPTSGSATSTPIVAATASTQATATKLSSVTARYQWNNKYDPKSAAFQTAYAAGVSSLQNISGPAGELARFFNNTANCNAYSPSDSLADTIKKFDDCSQSFISSATDPATGKAATLDDLRNAASKVLTVAAQNAALYRNAIATAAGIPFTIEYVYSRPQSQPDTHDVRGILAWNAGAGILNANVAVSFYGAERPSNATYGRFRDIQFAAEFDRSFSAKSPTAPSWSVAAYGQWQQSPSVITWTDSTVPAGITLPANSQSFITGTKGFLAVVQGKLVFKIGSAQLPVSAKWSNKTDLLDKKSYGGQFGLTYDLSQVKKLLGLGSGT